MSKTSLDLVPVLSLSKIGDRGWTRELWRLAYRQARAQIRARRAHGIGDAYVWCLDHLRRRFGASGWKVAQAAARLVMERKTPSYAASGSVADLHRQELTNAAGHPTRCVSVERHSGWRMAWCADPLASVNGNRMLRVTRARQLREDRARRREVARAMAADRLALNRRRPEPGDRYTLTPAGLAALQQAEAACA